MASDGDREAVERLRHEVYALELGHHPSDLSGRLVESGWADAVYVLARVGEEVVGFVSITPPWAPGYAIERYLSAEAVADVRATQAFEVRALTVAKEHRSGGIGAALMYAATRWISSHGGLTLMAMGRTALRDVYTSVGLEFRGVPIQAGAVEYELMTAEIGPAESWVTRQYGDALRAFEQRIDWRINVPFWASETSQHGGTSFEAVGTRFDDLDRSIVTADVLDAWFAPAPGVVRALVDDVAWLCRTSPPTHGPGLREAIATARGIPDGSIVLGAGSSDLMYRVLPRLVERGSRVLVLRPTYGEYPHLLGRVLGARVDSLRLREEDGWQLDLDELRGALQRDYDLVVLVNPANPTGRHLDAGVLGDIVASAPAGTLVWLDEAYVEYAGTDQSLELRAATAANVIVCKSMSKVYALSGQRVAYLATHPDRARELNRHCPPWPVSLPGQLAGVRALRDPGHYEDRWRQTAVLRRDLAAGLAAISGVRVYEAQANFVLVRLPEIASAGRVTSRCQESGVYVRDLSPLSADFMGRYVRVAVKDAAANSRIVLALADAVADG